MTTSSRATVLQKGSQGSEVTRLQVKLNNWLDSKQYGRLLAEDGIFGNATQRIVRFFQCHHFLMIDGIVGPYTQACLERGVAALPTLRAGNQGSLVRRVQEVLKNYGIDPGALDGVYGAKTYAAVIRFQNDYHIYDVEGNATGEVGLSTWMHLALEPANISCGPLTVR
jgi:peptidoglycan hydrolase-like protein with peptidoglycan-binding domain